MSLRFIKEKEFTKKPEKVWINFEDKILALEFLWSWNQTGYVSAEIILETDMNLQKVFLKERVILKKMYDPEYGGYLIPSKFREIVFDRIISMKLNIKSKKGNYHHEGNREIETFIGLLGKMGVNCKRDMSFVEALIDEDTSKKAMDALKKK